jgi:succinoglycan biosynthesis protein ExoA
VIVVDGESTDRTAAIATTAAAADPRIRLVPNPGRTTPDGLNVGIQLATGDYIGAVIGHSIPSADYVERAVQASIHTGAWSVGGRIVRRAENPMHRAIALATSSRVGVGDSVHNYATTAGWVETVFPGFWRRDLFDRIGLFDTQMVANEDNELSLRIRKAGGRIWYDPEIRVAYVPRASIGGLFRQYRLYGLGKMRVLRKHRGGLRWRHVIPAAWVAFVVLGGLVGAFVSVIGLLWLGGLAAYGLTILVAAVRLGRTGAAWWRIALALVTIHHAYGIGTWQGVATWRSTARPE